MPKAKTIYTRAAIFRQAWRAARHDAACFGGKPQHHLPSALKLAHERAAASREMRSRIMAMVAKFKADQEPEARAKRDRELREFMDQCEEDCRRATAMGRRDAA